MSVCLVILQNHQFLKNIEVSEAIYEKRFSNTLNLAPLYAGDRSHIIGVFGNSHFFQGYLAQAYRSLSALSFHHYIFIADDLIRNSCVNQDNYRDFFGLVDQGESFIPGFIEFPKMDFRWARSEEALR